MIRCARCRSSKLSNSKSNPDFYQFTLVCDTTMPAPWHRLNISLCSDYMFWCLLSRNLLQFWPFLAFYGHFRPDSNQSSELDSSSGRFYKRVKDYATVSSPQKVINSNSWIQNELVSNRNEHKKFTVANIFEILFMVFEIRHLTYTWPIKMQMNSKLSP